MIIFAKLLKINQITNLKPFRVKKSVAVNKSLFNARILCGLAAKTGTNIYFMNGIYKSNRKGIDGAPLIKMDSKKSVFFNIGISYNI